MPTLSRLTPRPAGAARRRRCSSCVAVLLLCGCLCGCASVSNPVGDGIPVRRLPPEVFGESKENEQPIPLTSLRQPPQKVYRLAAGDVLGVWIEGVLGDRNSPPPVRLPERGDLPASLGYPIPVRDDGTMPLPLVEPVKVEGMSIVEAQAAIIKAYTVTKKIIQPGRERVIVTLMQPRRYHVLVVREDAGSVTIGATGGNSGINSGTFISETRRSSGFPLDLPAYENDVLNALTRTGGLPGPEAENEVIIERGGGRSSASSACRAPLPKHQVPMDRDGRHSQGTGDRGSSGTQIVQIPLRLRPGERPPFRPSDIILETGDVVYVRLRRGEQFYTGGLLPPRAFPLPFGRDLDVIEAMALVGGPLANGGFSSGITGGSVSSGGLGSSSPSMLTILRRTPGSGQIPIRVSLNRALRDPRERILIQPDDILILQSTMTEALAQYISGQLNFGFSSPLGIRQRDLSGSATLTLPGGSGAGSGGGGGLQ